MYLVINKDNDQQIEFYSYTRTLNIDTNSVYFMIEFSFTDNYVAGSIDKLARYAGEDITSLVVKNGQDEFMNIESDKIELLSLHENCSSDGRYGVATIRQICKDNTVPTVAN